MIIFASNNLGKFREVESFVSKRGFSIDLQSSYGVEEVPDTKRTARFYCVMVYLKSAEDPIPIISEGAWEGIIARKPLGQRGFGYDPIFFLPKQGCTAAQLEPGLKNKLSHRGQALFKLVRLMKARGVC